MAAALEAGTARPGEAHCGGDGGTADAEGGRRTRQPHQDPVPGGGQPRPAPADPGRGPVRQRPAPALAGRRHATAGVAHRARAGRSGRACSTPCSTSRASMPAPSVRASRLSPSPAY
ncbi:MAG: hypothetical protein MZW92_76940 [Comamonadaceae bacterium]|nr:hypothetical protein [Comamonadaceae bacterium]